jgi:hypothetical protein
VCHVVGTEYQGEFGGVIGAFPGARRDVGEIAGVVVAVRCCICCVAVAKT